LSQGVDDRVKTLYSPPSSLLRAPTHFIRGLIVNSRHAARTARPLQGQVAFARAAAMGSRGKCDAIVGSSFVAGLPDLERREHRLNPGEGSA